MSYKAYFPWKVTWGKNKRYEDRFKTKLGALKGARTLKLRNTANKTYYYNVRVSKVSK